MTIATQTPNTPMPKYFPNRKLQPILQTHMETIEIHIVTFASPAALKVDGSENATGQMVMQLTVWKYRICRADSAVSAERLYARKISGSNNTMIAFVTMRHR